MFIKFTETNKRFGSSAVSIRKGSAQFGFSSGAVNSYGVGDKYKYAVLFYDADSKKVGIQLTNDKDEEGVFEIKKIGEKNNNVYVSAKSFCDKYGIEYSETRSCPLYQDEEFLVFEVSQDACDT